MKPILVTSYVNPDLDGVAGIIAYSEFLNKINKNALAGVLGNPSDEAKYILDHFGFEYPENIESGEYFDEIILVDTSDLNGPEGKIAPEKVIEIIDHRKINETDKFPNAKTQIELVGAAATLVAERFIENKVDISKKSATLICGAIISGTLNFKGGVTTDRDRIAFNYLNQVAQLPHNFYKELFGAKSDLSGNKLKEIIIGDLAQFNISNKSICITQIEMIGARKLVNERIDEILEQLNKIKSEANTDIVFQTILDLEETKNFFITSDPEIQKLLMKVLGVKWNGPLAERDGLILRKQIMPLIKDELEKQKT